MDTTELFAGALYAAVDLKAASRRLADQLKSSNTDIIEAEKAGLDPTLIDSLRALAPIAPTAIDHACSMGAAWVLGTRSIREDNVWEAVASLPPSMSMPGRLRRTTAETLIGLANTAESYLRFAAPYMDEQGLGYISDSVIAATLRGVTVEIIRPGPGERERIAIEMLQLLVLTEGDTSNLLIVETRDDSPFPHLKVMTVDGRSAYVGSANLTAAALEGRNLEFGVLVRGEQVRAVDGFLNMYTVR